MTRHPSLAHLSREHHGALILARLLQKGAPAYKGLPTDTEGKAAHAMELYQKELVPHFASEEKVFPWAKEINAELDALIDQVFKDHVSIREAFAGIGTATDRVGHLDQLGKQLEAHVRREERELFPMMEKNCSPGLLEKIDKTLSSNS